MPVIIFFEKKLQKILSSAFRCYLFLNFLKQFKLVESVNLQK